MRQTVSLVVAGMYGAGKTTFISTISEIPLPVPATNPEGKPQTDYGRKTVDDDLVLQFFGAPGHVRYDFMWEIMAEGMLGFFLLVDSTQPQTFPAARAMLNTFASYAPVPYIIVATKQDMPDALPYDEVGQRVQIHASDVAMACIATDDASVQPIVLKLLYMILEETES
jgi:uncharacterized protein